MEDADKLRVQLDLWLEKQEQCIEKLLAAAQELENLHVSSSAFQMAGKTAAVAGFFATIFSECLYTPMGFLAAAEIDTTVQLRETINKIKTLIKDVEEIGGTLLNKLNAKCASQGQGASAASDDESDECEVTTQIMRALARKYGMDVPLEVLRRFNKATVFNQQKLDGPDVALTWKTGAAALLTLNMDLKSAIKRSVLVAEEALSACDLVRNIEEIKNNRTEASQSLQSAARKMKEETGNLREMTDAPLEIIKELSEFPTLLKDLGGYSLTVAKAEQKVLDYVKKTCIDKTFLSVVDKNRTAFLNLFRFFRDYLLKCLEERKRSHVHIVFVAHGSIVAEFIPASDLVPSYIKDTILYTPWNCGISAPAAAGIAVGCITPRHREFYKVDQPFIRLDDDHLPQRWNSMRESRNEVPQIYLGPVTPDERVWNVFMELVGSVYRDDRIIIPYLQPDKNAPPVPFYMLILGTSYILMFKEVEATVHLAACLGRGTTQPTWREWAAQYGYTEDNTEMTMNITDMIQDPLMLQALSMMFDNQQQGETR